MEFMEFYENDFSEFEKYLQSVEHRKLCFQKGEIFNTNEGRYYYYILEGRTHSLVLNETGKMRVNPNFFKKGAIFPLYAPKSAERSLSLLFSAATDCAILMFDHNVMSACLQANADFNQAMYACYIRLVNHLGNEVEAQLFSTGLVNLCRFFCRVLEGKKDQEGVLSFTQDELSLYIGLDRSNIGRCLKQLRDDRVLETGRNKIIIKNIEKLREYSRFEEL